MPKVRPGLRYPPHTSMLGWRISVSVVFVCLSALALTAGCQDATPQIGSGKPLHTAGQTVRREAGHFTFKVPQGFVEVAKYSSADNAGRSDSRSAILMPESLTTAAEQGDYILVEALTATPFDLAAIASQLRSEGVEVSQTTAADAPALRISEVPIANREMSYLIDSRDLVEPKTDISGMRITARWHKHEQEILSAWAEIIRTLKIT